MAIHPDNTTTIPHVADVLPAASHHCLRKEAIVTLLTSTQAHHAVTLFSLAEATVPLPFVAAECGFAALDALAACVVHHGQRLQSPRASALILTACVSIGWKLASRDAAPHHVAACWNRLGLHGPGIRLDTREIVEQEVELLTLLQYKVALPSWWLDVSHFAANYVSRLTLHVSSAVLPQPSPPRTSLQDMTNAPCPSVTKRLTDIRPHVAWRGGRDQRPVVQFGESPVQRNEEHRSLCAQRRYMQTHAELLAANVQAVLLNVALVTQQQSGSQQTDKEPRNNIHCLLCAALAMTGILPLEAIAATFSLSSH